MDPSTVGAASVARATDATAAEAARVAGNLLTRLLGPSADVVGLQWANAVKQRNLARLLRKTEKRAEKEADPGIANPRLASKVFEGAQYADDEVVAEYFSGVLSSSRDHEGKNDAGVAWSALISRLSSDQLKLHYLIYASLRDALIDTNPERVNSLNGVDVLLSLDDLFNSGGFSTVQNGAHRFSDAVDGLMREGLIEAQSGYAYGPIDSVKTSSRSYGAFVDAPFERGVRVAISIHGIRLYLWGMGIGHGDANQYTNRSVIIEPSEESGALKRVRGGVYSKMWTDTDPKTAVEAPQDPIFIQPTAEVGRS